MTSDAQSRGAASPEPPNATPDDPLLDCLVFLSRFHGRPLSRDALTAGLPRREQLDPALFVRAAERAGLSARVQHRPLHRISQLLLPAVLLLEDGSACVLLGIDREQARARVMQPEAGESEEELALQDLEAQYTGYAIFLRPAFRFDRRTPETAGRRGHWFWGTLAQYSSIYRDVLVASLLINVFALATPLFIMNVYDRVVPNNARETLWVLATGVVIVYLFDHILRGLRARFIDIAGRNADVILSSQVFERALGLRMASRPNSVGVFANHLGEFENVRTFITSATITTLLDLPFILLFIAVIFVIGGSLALVPAVLIPVVLVYGFWIQPRLREAVDNNMRGASQKNATLVESLVGVETIKALGAEGEVQKKWEESVDYTSGWGARSRELSASALNTAVLMQQLALVGVIVVGVYLINLGELTMGGLIAGVILTGRAMAPMGQVSNLATHFHQTVSALRTLDRLMKLPAERPEDKSFVHRPHLSGDIEFSEVVFRYPQQQGDAALDEVSLRIRAGEHVALVGRTGSGKTTLEKLIMGLYEPEEGAVRIDGIDVQQIDPAELRRNVGYVAQEVTLFYGTVRDNIVFGAPYVDDAAVVRAAEMSAAADFINRHPLGFDMPVGERGSGLSGGQRQTIALARALVLDPPILILDEPTNSMDHSTEQRLKANLAQVAKGKTLVVVSHRASLLDLVERIVVLDRGRVVADGPREEVRQALKQGQVKVPEQ